MSAGIIDNNCEMLEELLSALEAPSQTKLDTLHQIEMELHGLSAKAKAGYTSKVRSFQGRIQGIRRVILFAGAASKANAGLVQNQAQMEQKQQASSKLLTQAAQQLEDTIQVGNETTQEFARQNAQMAAMRTQMVEVNSGIKAGGLLINKMSQWHR